MLLGKSAVAGGIFWEKSRKIAAAAKTSAAIVAADSLGLRFDQRQVRTGNSTGRARIERPCSQRSRSTAKSPALR